MTLRQKHADLSSRDAKNLSTLIEAQISWWRDSNPLLSAVLEFMPLSHKERKQRLDSLLGKFGIADKRRQVAATLSGGERRRLEIARCLASKPKLILLDEPFTGIDPVTIHSIQDIIDDLKRSGIAILLTDHRERETLTITDRSYIVFAGKVLVSGNAETVLRDEKAQQYYFGKRFDADSIIGSKGVFQGTPTPPPFRDAA